MSGILGVFNSLPSIVCSSNPDKEFKILCQNARDADDIRLIVGLYEMNMRSFHIRNSKKSYNKYIGWALPSQAVLGVVADFWGRHSDSSLVDFGCGSGVFCLMFHDEGIPQNRLQAVDVTNPNKEYYGDLKTFWPIVRSDDYKVAPTDIFFIAWGVSAITNAVESYIDRGGWCVIILGENDCTFDCDYFYNRHDWKCKSRIHVSGPASNLSEFLTINVRRKKKRTEKRKCVRFIQDSPW